MGQRGELFSTRVILQNRTYFFNVKENRTGDLYLNIVESKNRDTGGFDRQSVILFASDLQEFLKGFDESLRILEKEVRERRRSPRTVVREDGNGAEDRASGRPGGLAGGHTIVRAGSRSANRDEGHSKSPGKFVSRAVNRDEGHGRTTGRSGSRAANRDEGHGRYSDTGGPPSGRKQSFSERPRRERPHEEGKRGEGKRVVVKKGSRKREQ